MTRIGRSIDGERGSIAQNWKKMINSPFLPKITDIFSLCPIKLGAMEA